MTQIDRLYSPHIPTAHIDLTNIRHNFRILQESSKHALASESDPFYAIASLPSEFAHFEESPNLVWPSQIAVIKSDAYGHGHVKVAHALMQDGVKFFATGGIQEACELRQGLKQENLKDSPIIISLLGIIEKEDIELCIENGLIPLIHCFEQIDMLKSAKSELPIVIKCNTGMARLGFNFSDIAHVIEKLKKLDNVLPLMALSHLHSGDTDNGKEEVIKQGALFANMLKELRAQWPHLAASLGNSAGTLLAKEITNIIGPHVCRPGIALYGINPFHNTKLESLEQRFLPTMWVSAPVISMRTLEAGAGISYGHIYTAKQDMPVAVLATGYADGFSRGLTHKTQVCINGKRVPLVGRVAMQMIFADLSALHADGDTSKPSEAWLLGGPYAQGVEVQELAKNWGTITHEVMCMLGYNTRVYKKFENI